jgi:uncharacterized protein (TIGR02246 family)
MPTNTTAELAPEDAAAIAGVPQAIIAAWGAHDADAFAAQFTEDASMVLPGSHVTGRDAVRKYMAAGFAGPYKGTQVVGEPRSMRALGPGSAVVVTLGGVRSKQATELTEAQQVFATWVLAKQDGTWRIAAYHNGPAHTG